jgi:hypothetical protein
VVLAAVGGSQRIDGLEAPLTGRESCARCGRCSTRRRTGGCRGRCLAYGDGAALWALAEIVRQRLSIAEEDPADVAAGKLAAGLDRFVTDPGEPDYVRARLGRLLGVAAEEYAGAVLAREELFAGWRLFFERLAAQAPVVMLTEDAQHADAAVLGTSFSAGALAAVSGHGEPAVRAGLADLVRREVLSVSADPLSPERGSYQFASRCSARSPTTPCPGATARPATSPSPPTCAWRSPATARKSPTSSPGTTRTPSTQSPTTPTADIRGQAITALIRAADRAARTGAPTAAAASHADALGISHDTMSSAWPVAARAAHDLADTAATMELLSQLDGAQPGHSPRCCAPNVNSFAPGWQIATPARPPPSLPLSAGCASTARPTTSGTACSTTLSTCPAPTLPTRPSGKRARSRNGCAAGPCWIVPLA